MLRVIEEREFQRLGGTRLLKADVRVVAATNRDLWKAVEGGDFREDLFYRLQVFDIWIAPVVSHDSAQTTRGFNRRRCDRLRPCSMSPPRGCCSRLWPAG